jgi:hypothetical protein
MVLKTVALSVAIASLVYALPASSQTNAEPHTGQYVTQAYRADACPPRNFFEDLFGFAPRDCVLPSPEDRSRSHVTVSGLNGI